MADRYVKLFTKAAFSNVAFAELLSDTGIEAVAVREGVILNYTQFESVPAARLPHWVWLNREDIRSKLRTRPASMREFRDAEGSRRNIRLIGVYGVAAFCAWEFGSDMEEMYTRFVHEGNVGPWEKVWGYDTTENGDTIYRLRCGLNILSSDVMRLVP